MKTTKKCRVCKIDKTFDSFHKNNSRKDGCQARCKKCSKEYNLQNKAKTKKYNIKYYKDNSEIIKDNSKQFRANNKESLAEYHKSYQKINKEKKAKYQSLYYYNNKDDLVLKQKAYAKTKEGNMAIRNAGQKRRFLVRAFSDGTIPIGNIYPLTKELLELLKSQEYRCNNCGCDITDKKHLDHHFPISKGGLHTLSNVVFLCPTCNLRKGATMPNTLLLI